MGFPRLPGQIQRTNPMQQAVDAIERVALETRVRVLRPAFLMADVFCAAPAEEEVCACGCAFGDHAARGPHRCLEWKGPNRCPCAAFARKRRGGIVSRAADVAAAARRRR